MQSIAAKGCVAMLSVAMGVATAAAQPSKQPNPTDPGAAAPPVKYDSAFSEYQPFREQQIRPWKEVNKEVADNPAMGSMGSMKHAPGKEAMAGHDMSSMKDMPGMSVPGMDKKGAAAGKSKAGVAGHDMGAMKDMPGMDRKAAAPPKSKEGHAGHDMRAMKDTPGKGTLAMAKAQAARGQPFSVQPAALTATGVVQIVDKANGKVKLTHDPIAVLGWPKMTMFFRLKDNALADQVKEGDKVEFSLEKSTSGYVISGLQKGTAHHDTKQMK